MSFELIHLPGSDALVEILRGPVDSELLRGLSEALERRGITSPGMRKLIDLRDADVRVSVEEMREHAAWQLEHGTYQTGTVTAIVTEQPRATAISLMFANLVEDQRRIEVFSTLRVAVEWLDLDAKEVAAAWPAAAHELLD